MKESRLYLNFFKTNFPVFFIAVLVSLSLGFFYTSKQLPTYVSTEIWEIEYSENNISERTAVVDTLIEVLRTANLQNQLGIQNQSKVSVYKKAPLLVELSVTSSSNDQSMKILSKIDGYISVNYPIHKIGETNKAILNPQYFKNILIASIFGLIISVLYLLVREYFRKY